MSNSSEDANERDLFLEKESLVDPSNAANSNNERRWRRIALLFIILFLIQMTLSVIWLSTHAASTAFANGFDTDLVSFKSSIKLVKRRFTGGLYPDEAGNLYTQPTPDELRYVGNASKEIHQNWESLIAGRYYKYSSLEQDQLDSFGREAGVQSPNPINEAINAKGVFGGVDLFHSLHCLNFLRKAVAQTMDNKHELQQENFMQVHTDHCVDHLRQAIMCYGDLTPVTLTPVFNSDSKVLNLVGQTEYLHTCRDWDSLQQALHRRNGFGDK